MAFYRLLLLLYPAGFRVQYAEELCSVFAVRLREASNPLAVLLLWFETVIDVLLTAAYVGYASDMLIGQIDPRTVSQAWHIPARMSAVDSALVHTLEDSSMADGLAAMAPQDSGYAVLRREYAHYRELAAAGG